MSDLAKAIVGDRNSLKDKRSNWESQWQEISDFILPRRNRFVAHITPGTDIQRRIVENTAQRAVGRFAAGLQNIISPKAIQWFDLAPADESLVDDRDVAIWLDDTGRRIAKQLASPVTNFYPKEYIFLVELGAFGTAVMSIEDVPGKGPVIKHHFLGACFIEEGEDGIVNRAIIEITLTGHKIFERFGFDKISDKARRAIEKDMNAEHKVLWSVVPRADKRRGKAQSGKPFTSVFVLESDRAVLDVGGFNEFPIVVWRWQQGSNEIYGRGPGDEALPDTKMLQQMEMTNLKSAQKLVDPPLLAPNDGTLGPIRTKPGGITYLRPGTRPDESVRPLLTGGQLRAGELKAEQTRQNIRETFFLDVMELPGVVAQDGDVIRMSATEALIRKQDRIGVLGPIAGRGETEFLSPTIERVFQIMLRAGMLLPVPPALQATGVNVNYTSPLVAAQQVGEANAFTQAVGTSAQLLPFDPGALDWANINEAGRGIAQRLNVPAKWTRSRREVEEIQRGRQEQQQRQAAAEAAVNETQALQNAAKAQDIVAQG
jgi:hypothetical protein